MSQSNPFNTVEYAEPPKTSGLAVASLICSLIFCCPPTVIIGPLLGLGAIVSISANPTIRKGRGIAIAGVVIGVVLTAAWTISTYVLVKLASETEAHMRSAPNSMLAAGFAGDTPGFRTSAAGKLAAATDEEILAFIAQLRGRYGEFVSATYDEAAFIADATIEKLIQPTQDHPFSLKFANGTIDSEFGISRNDPATGGMLWGEVRIVRIRIIDPDQGDIEFP